ncbi:MAG TPA: hypothetical protein VGL69_16820 [Solirubrobacteraceae bacterium]
MKRLTIGIVTALAMLVAAGSAIAAIDTYAGGYTFNGKAGSKSSPAPLNFTQHFTLTAANQGSLTGILNKVTTSIGGVKVDATGFPTCSATHVNGWNKSSYASVCPKGSLVASGSIKAQLGTSSQFTPQGLNCDPNLDVWNAGGGKLTFFFETTSSAQCLGGQITTGQTPAFTATYKQSGNNLLVTIPVPNAVTHIGPYLASLSSEYLKWHSTTFKGHRDITSVGCKGKRHFSYTFSATAPNQPAETKTIKGEAACG